MICTGKNVMASPETLLVIREPEEIDALIDYAKDPALEWCAYDTETDGLALSARVVGLSVCLEDNLAFYVVTREWRFDRSFAVVDCARCAGTGAVKPKGKTKESQPCEACNGTAKQEKAVFTNCRLDTLPNEEKVKELLGVLQTKALIMHNSWVDINWTFRNYGIDLKSALVGETMAAAHLLDENRRVGLKELGYTEFGEAATAEQQDMKASVLANGGVWETKRGGEKSMYKADAAILGLYGAKDALLTYRLWMRYSEQLEAQGLTQFYLDETLPMARDVIYDLNTVGLRCDVEGFHRLQKDLEDECALLQSQIEQDLAPYVAKEYPKGFGKGAKKFNIGSGQQLAWLLFKKLDQDWTKLTDAGRDLAKQLLGKAPYNPSARKAFERAVAEAADAKGRPLKVEKYLSTSAAVLAKFAHKYKWVDLLLRYKKAQKLLTTYAIGISEKIEYGVIHPSFMQCSTTGNRLSSRGPNFQNLPRDDKRIKALILARPGKVFVGGDQEQIEPRVFASFSGDKRLLECFASGQDVYSVIGIGVFGKYECTPYKSGKGSFGETWPLLRQVAKEVMLAATYGITAFKLTDVLNLKAPRKGGEGPWTIEEVQEILNKYFEAYPDVRKLQEKYHQLAINNGAVFNLFGRPRHIPQAKLIKNFGKKVKPMDLPYEYRTLLNNSVNFPIQGTAGSILNRILIAIYAKCRELGATDPVWAEVHIVGQVHDEAWMEGPEHLAQQMVEVMKYAMENSVALPGVLLKCQPKIGRTIAELK